MTRSKIKRCRFKLKPVSVDGVIPACGDMKNVKIVTNLRSISQWLGKTCVENLTTIWVEVKIAFLFRFSRGSTFSVWRKMTQETTWSAVTLRNDVSLSSMQRKFFFHSGDRKISVCGMISLNSLNSAFVFLTNVVCNSREGFVLSAFEPIVTKK